MSPEIVLSKLALLQEVLTDLKPHLGQSRVAQQDAHYEIERQVQLAVDLSVSIGRRWLELRDHPVPATGREIFLELARRRILPSPLAGRLGRSVGLRNLIIHEYGVIDYDLFFSGLRQGHSDFVAFQRLVARVFAAQATRARKPRKHKSKR